MGGHSTALDPASCHMAVAPSHEQPLISHHSVAGAFGDVTTFAAVHLWTKAPPTICPEPHVVAHLSPTSIFQNPPPPQLCGTSHWPLLNRRSVLFPSERGGRMGGGSSQTSSMAGSCSSNASFGCCKSVVECFGRSFPAPLTVTPFPDWRLLRRRIFGV